MIGQTLGHYRIVERLGEGGMGEVFRGIDEMLDRDVAMKMLRPELAHRADVADRFRAEAVTLAKLDHPNIARLHGMVKADPHLFMVMEFVPGETLAARVERQGRLAWREAVEAIVQVLDGLQYAHELGVVHRDVKPANLIVRPDGRVKITDFGIARVLGTSRATRTGFMVGTLEYMAPEQIRGEDVDARADLYAAGIVLYQLLTGRVPFEATTEFELMRLQLEGAAPSVQPVAGSVPAWLDELIARALTKVPSDRYASAAAFRAELSRLAADEPDDSPVKPTRFVAAPVAPTRLASVAVSPTRMAHIRAMPARVGSRARRWAAAAVVLVALVAGITAWKATRPRPERPRPVDATAGVDIPSDHSAPPPAPPAPLPSAPSPIVPRVPRVPRPAPEAPREAPAPVRVTPPVTPREASPAAPPSIAPPRAANPPVVHPDVYFNEESLTVIDGKKTHQRDIILRFVGAKIELLDRKTRIELRSVSLATLDSAIYSRSKQPRWKTASAGVLLGGVFAAPLFFLKGTQHWLTLEGAGEPVVIRLDKNSWEGVIAEIERRSTIKVTMATDKASR